jgi:hypothetical protein
MIYEDGDYSHPHNRTFSVKGNCVRFGTGDTLLIEFNKRIPQIRFLNEGTGK